MKDQFKKLPKTEAVPDGLKEEVFNSIDSIKLFASILDLFTAKYSLSEMMMIDLAAESADNKKDKEPDLKNKEEDEKNEEKK